MPEPNAAPRPDTCDECAKSNVGPCPHVASPAVDAVDSQNRPAANSEARGYTVAYLEALHADRDTLLADLDRCQRRLERQVELHREYRERARAAEQALQLYGEPQPILIDRAAVLARIRAYTDRQAA